MTEETEKVLLRYLCYLLFNQSACEKIVLDGCFEQEGTEQTEEESLGLACPIYPLTLDWWREESGSIFRRTA